MRFSTLLIRTLASAAVLALSCENDFEEREGLPCDAEQRCLPGYACVNDRCVTRTPSDAGMGGGDSQSDAPNDPSKEEGVGGDHPSGDAGASGAHDGEVSTNGGGGANGDAGASTVDNGGTSAKGGGSTAGSPSGSGGGGAGGSPLGGSGGGNAGNTSGGLPSQAGSGMSAGQAGSPTAGAPNGGTGGSGGITCNPGFVPCTNGSCVPSDVNNCGQCGRVCAASDGYTATCTNGECGTICPSNIVCDGKCCALNLVCLRLIPIGELTCVSAPDL